MSERHDFTAGDAVPEWVERVEGGATVTFGCDVVVYRMADGVHVYPVRAGESCIVSVANGGGEVVLHGAPTYIHHWPHTAPPRE